MTASPDCISIPSELLEAIPSLDGKNFFTKSSDLADDYILDTIDIFPMNPYQEYQAPMPDFHWLQGSEIHQWFDKNLVKIQGRQAHTTRPLDKLAVELTNKKLNSFMDCPGFIHHIRSQLTITARLIQEMHKENYDNVLAPRNETTVAYHDAAIRTKAGSDFS
ncbi:hypothetical protein BGZ49_004125 [Haplosporangium sp. Z 27]|nr:hypothetical protein BGZ49_004125 [Haplosporangium sp. Z 27]